MTIPTTALDETSPAGGTNISLGDNRIREYKAQVREVMEVDHVFPSSGQSANAGKHKSVHLTEAADIGTGASGLPIIGAQTINSVPELVYTTEDDVDIQLTSAGKLCTTSLTTVASISTIMNLIYPIGYVITLGVSTNPGTLLGVGTWTAIAGKVIVGIDGTQTEFDTLDETGGSKTHTLTTAEIPSHTHSQDAANHNGWSGSANYAQGSEATLVGTDLTSGATGGGGAHNNLQPYIVKYCWQRVS